jgi:ABC-type cobalt transport system substrate-binding protein
MARISGRFLVLLVLSAALMGGSASAAEKWPGIDEAVVNKIAREQGRPERPSLIPAAEGDLQLFMFLVAGVVGGFVAGYYWRVLLEGKKKVDETKE